MAEPAPRILVVEDDPMMRELITTRLALAGYETFQARNGHEALEKVASIRPAAMILDINMPELDGFRVLETLRATGGVERVRIMVMTARNQTADVRRAVSLGARDFMTKPFDDARFLARVARLMRRTSSPPGASAAQAEPVVWIDTPQG
jgi:two-component system OmpR family response regulator